MLKMNDLCRFVAGSIIPTMMILVGFLPQVYHFLATGNIEGYSFGLSFLDALGCLSNTIVLFAGKDVNLLDACESAVPLISIMTAHAILLCTASVVSSVGVSPRASKADSNELDRTLLDVV